ncbi:MAG TPA: lactate racemase domain-containing protein, partial [Thermosynergistes sp.]|nr:lactate racemase domain-containing protein [Thermosynergistes sp.]
MTVVSAVKKLLCDMPIPRMVKVRQRFERPKIEDVASELVKKLKDKGVLSAIKPGQSVAIGVGSRGITNLPLMVKTLVDAIKGAGGEPFIVPAMGSHGGATAEGQKGVLERLGVAEEYVGVPIRSSMEVVEIGRTSKGLPVRIDKHALSADHIAIINRIKLHTTFRGKYESGLMKMITIGLGKQAGAEICHELGFEQMAENVVAIAKVALQKMNLLFAVGVIENAYHETARIAVLEKDEIEEEEPKLLEEAKRLYPKIPFDSLDVLIIDEIGKDISGTGFDTNIVGRYTVPTMTGGPSIKRVVVLDITDKSHGNGNGLG